MKTYETGMFETMLKHYSMDQNTWKNLDSLNETGAPVQTSSVPTDPEVLLVTLEQENPKDYKDLTICIETQVAAYHLKMKAKWNKTLQSDLKKTVGSYDLNKEFRETLNAEDIPEPAKVIIAHFCSRTKIDEYRMVLLRLLLADFRTEFTNEQTTTFKFKELEASSPFGWILQEENDEPPNSDAQYQNDLLDEEF